MTPLAVGFGECYRDYVGPGSPLNEVADRPRQRRADAIDGCSHWPW